MDCVKMFVFFEGVWHLKVKEDHWLSHLCCSSGLCSTSPKLAPSVETPCKIISRPNFWIDSVSLVWSPSSFVPGEFLPTQLGSDCDSRHSCHMCNINREQTGDDSDAHFACIVILYLFGSLFSKSLPKDEKSFFAKPTRHMLWQMKHLWNSLCRISQPWLTEKLVRYGT